MQFDIPKTVHTNGINMEYFDEGEGPAVLLLHGFPDLPYSWRRIARPIIEAGFRVIAPSQRGYGGTDAPAGPAGYNVRNLVADLTGLLDCLEVDAAVWFGHDWGGMPAWHSGLYAPDRVLGLGSLGLAYTPLTGDQDVVEIYDELRGPQHYIRTFQQPGMAESVLEHDVEHTFTSLLRGRGYTKDEFADAPDSIRELPIGVFVGNPQLLGEPIVGDEELQYYVKTFERTGFTGALNWYRALREDYEEAIGLDYVIDKPALIINAPDDWFYLQGSTDGMPALLPQLEMHDIEDAAHWLQLEKPDEVTSIIVPWLTRNFLV